MASLLKWFSNSDVQAASTRTTECSLPASWYHSSDLYQLERRAVFSRKWMLITHKLRFTNPGDYLRVTEAGFTFILILDRTGVLRAFHNICRHRGFPILHEDSGNAKILTCNYHGWSYGTNGKLAKAAHFENFTDFDKEQNGLLPIHTHTDSLGFVWINLDASTIPSTSWNEQLEGVDTQKRFQPFNMDEYRFDHTWSMQGDYNWKTLADNYNECLHCHTAHPDTRTFVDVRVYRVDGKAGHLQHSVNFPDADPNAIKPASTYYFPNACMTVTAEFFYLMRCNPTSSTTCSMEYEVYRHKDATDEAFNNIDQIFKRVLKEDKWLCNNVQKNLEAGVYVNGPLHPEYEAGPLYFQELVKETVVKHRSEEKRLGMEIWPAAVIGIGANGKTKEEVDFCVGLGCGTGSKEIAW